VETHNAGLDRLHAMATPPRFICFLCQRKFKSAALVTRHKQLSDLHKRNLQKQDEEIQQRKEQLRQEITGIRKRMQEVEAPKTDNAQQRYSLELKLRQTMGDYGQAQEKLEASRSQERGVKRSEAYETRLGRLSVSVGVATWQGNKDVQEDRFVLNVDLEASDGTRIIGFCVLDGHSGSLCVDAIVEWWPRNLQKCLSAKPALTEEHLRQAVTEACVLTDDEFLARAREREDLDGSTALLCLIYPSRDASSGWRMLLANIGDSRAVLCRSHRAVRLTDDHKPGRADERRRIESKGGVVDMQGVWRVFTPGPALFGGRSVLWGLAVSRAFGDLLMKDPMRYGCAGATGELVTAVPEIHTYDLNPAEDRFLILACDGVWDVLSDEDAVSLCTEHRSVASAAHALIRRSFEIGSEDNITALVVTWSEDSDAKKARTEVVTD